MVRALFILCAACTVVGGWSLPVQAGAAVEPIRVTMISPTVDKKHPFWGDYFTFMNAAADSLGIDLRILWASDRYDVVEVASEALEQPEEVGYLMHVYRARSSYDILVKSEDKGVKSFLVNTAIIPDEQKLVGYPRGKFKKWIGHVYPDDSQAGKILAEKLLKRAVELQLTDKDDKVGFVGIGGSRDSAASILRGQGLQQFLQESLEANLYQYVVCGWDGHAAYSKTSGMLSRYPQAKVYWAASDKISINAQKAIRKLDMVPGRDYITGGVDWSVPGIEAIRGGSMVGSVGGHFLGGAWALTLLYDYHHGRDFAIPDATVKFHMRLIDSENLKTYLPVLNRANWSKIDFKRFTKTHNSSMKEYEFSPDAVVRELMRH